MAKQHSTWAAVLLGLFLAAPAVAQEQATVVRRDGSRVSGRFEAWNRNTNTLYVRVSLGDQQIIPLGQALLIDAEGDGQNLPETELGPARGPDHVLVTRAGEVVRGRLTNIQGGQGSGEEEQPRVVTFKAHDAGERHIPFAQVRRVYLGSYPAATAPAPTQLPDDQVPGSIRVGANAGWVDTGVNVRRADRVAFTTTGQVQISPDAEDRAISAGSLRGTKASAGAPMPGLLAGALIARVGVNGEPFPIGDETQPIPMPADGRLFLTVNDDVLTDNQGAFAVTLRVMRRRR